MEFLMNRQSWLRILLPILVIALAWLSGQAMLALKPEPARHSVQRPAPLVETITVHKGSVAFSIRSQGTVTPSHRTRLASEISGRVLAMSPTFVQGRRVAQGDALVTVDPTDYEVALAEAEAALVQAQLDLADRKARYEASSLAVQQALALLRASEARQRQARQDLANTIIRAPYDAVIEERHTDLGQYLMPGNPVAQLASTTVAEVRLPLPASDFALVAPAYFSEFPPTQATLHATLGNRQVQWPARIGRADAMLDDETRVFTLVATVDAPYDATPPLPIGLFVHADIAAQPLADAVRLPLSVLADDHVFVVREDQTLAQRPVEVLYRDSQHVIIGEGLAEGDRVMSTRLPMAFDGMAVSLQP